MIHTFRRLRARVLIRRFRRAAVVADRSQIDTAGAPIVVEHVDDPDRPLRLIRAAGLLSGATIDRLLETWANLSEPYALHLDLRDARIEDADTMRRLESALDQLEGQRIEIRLIGIDPYHPVLIA